MTELETNARFEFVGGVLDSLRSEFASAMKMKNPQLYRIVQAPSGLARENPWRNIAFFVGFS